jgi:hypothetical protein
MQPLAETRAKSTALLTIHGEGGAWGIPSSAVAGVERLETRTTEAPLELLSLLGIKTSPAADANAQARVLVLDVGGERVSLLVHGALHLADAAADDLLQLPASVQSVTPLISHLAVIDGKPALFVVSPERLLEAARRREVPHA